MTAETIYNYTCVYHGDFKGPFTTDCPECAKWREHDAALQPAEQKTGGSVDYYKCHVADPISGG